MAHTALPSRTALQNRDVDISADLPTLQPVPIEWQFPGRRGPWSPLTEQQKRFLRDLGRNPALVEGPGTRADVIQEQLKVVETELEGPRALPPEPLLRGGAGELVLRLSPPTAPPRAVVILRGGPLYLVQRQGTSWYTRQLTKFAPHMTQTMDLTGDGRPEIIAAREDGSGAVLTLQIFSWDDRHVHDLFFHAGASEPGQFGFLAPAGDGRRDLWIDSAATRGYFGAEARAHGPFVRDRYLYRWQDSTYQQVGHFRFATPFYHLNRYLFFAHQGDWQRAALHTEPGAAIDRGLVARLGTGPFSGGNDTAFVNGRFEFKKDDARFYAEFGATGRLLRLGRVTPQDPQRPTPVGRIAFVRGGNLWLWDAGAERQVTSGGQVTYPHFSADRRYIAFNRAGALWVVMADDPTATPWQVPAALHACGPAVWAPDRPALAVTEARGVVVVDVTEQGPGRPHVIAKGWSAPAWSPDGQTLAITQSKPGAEPFTGTVVLATVPRSGGSPRVMRAEPAAHESSCGPVSGATEFKWSADSRWLAFYRMGLTASLAADCNELVVVPVAGGAAVPVGVGPLRADWFDWSPQGAILALTDGSGRDAWTKVVRLASMPPAAPLRSVTPAGRTDRAPAWSPDGRQLALVRSKVSAPERMNVPLTDQAIWVLDTATDRVTKVLGSDGGMAPRWGAGGGLLWAKLAGQQGQLLYTPGRGYPPETVVDRVDQPNWYYGQWYWQQVFDWWSEGPTVGTAGKMYW